MLAYDDEFSIKYFRQNLRPYWRRNGDDTEALLKKAAADYESLKKRCEQFDAELMADLRNAGGEKYAQNHKTIREFVRAQGIPNFFDIQHGVCHQVLSEAGFALPG